MEQIIKQQPTEKDPIIVENYPYGFKRTKIKYYVESVKKKGDRFVSCTLNPKTNEWNKPKKSIYYAVIIVYKKENGHISYKSIYPSTDKEIYNRFIKNAENIELNELQKEQLRILKSYIKAYENVSYEIKATKFKNKITGEIVEKIPLLGINNYEKIENEEEEEEQKEIKQQINNLIAYNYQKDKGDLYIK